MAGDSGSDQADRRASLVKADEKSQESFDKTLLTLAGGALAISFAYFKEIAGSEPLRFPGFLVTSWICWSSSLAALLISHFTSHISLQDAICALDRGQRPDGGRFRLVTQYLNVGAAALFLLGLMFMTVFVATNLEGTMANKKFDSIPKGYVVPPAGPSATGPEEHRGYVTPPSQPVPPAEPPPNTGYVPPQPPPSAPPSSPAAPQSPPPGGK